MVEKKYRLNREGDHFKVTEQATAVGEEYSTKKKNYSFIFSSIKAIFGFLFSAVRILFSIIKIALLFWIATPVLFMSVLFNWIKLSILFAIFWFIVYDVYDTFILNHTALGIQPFNGTIVLIIMGLGLIATLIVTFAEMKE